MGTAIMAAGTDASSYANNYLPPVTGPLAWANLESDLLPAGRRLKNFGSLGGTFALSGIAQLVAKGVAAAAGTESRLTLGTFTPDAYTFIVLVDVGPDAGILRHRNIRISTNASKKLQRVMDAGTSVSVITAPATGAFAVFLCGDSTGHAFGIVTASGIQKSTSTAVNSGTTATWMGGTPATTVDKRATLSQSPTKADWTTRGIPKTHARNGNATRSAYWSALC